MHFPYGMNMKENKQIGIQLAARGRIPKVIAGLGAILICVPAGLAAPADSSELRRVDGGVLGESARRADAATLVPRRVGERTVIRANMPKQETSLADLRLSVQNFRIDNHPFISAEAIEAVLAPWKGRELSFPEFEQAVHAVAEYLRANGHPDAEVMVSRATVDRGVVAVAIQGLATGDVVAPTVAVREFDITGVTVASAEELKAVLEPWAERELTVAEMQKAAEAVAAFLRNKGYPLAQAFLPPQRIDTGIINIAVQEGIVDGSAGVNGLTVATPGERVRPQVIETVLAHGVTPGKPVSTAQLEHALRVASDIPGVRNVKATLNPGTESGTTQVNAVVEEGRLFSGSVWADNYGNRYSGTGRLSAVLNLNSPLGYGELFSLNLSRSQLMNSAKFAASVPLGSQGLRVGVSHARMNVDIGQEFRPLDLNSTTRINSAFASYPIKRSEENNIWASFNYDAKNIGNDLLGQQFNRRDIRVATLAFNGDVVDLWRGKTWWNFALSSGKQDDHGDPGSADGGFTRLNWNVSRLAPITADGRWSWLASFSGQYTNSTLDSVEKFQLGGPNGVRAYPVGEGLGDQGMLATLEVRRALATTRLGDLGVFGFIDAGQITQFRKLGPGDQLFGPNRYSLKGYGVGAELAKSETGSLRVVFAKKAGSNPNPTANGTDNDGQNKSARVWIFGNIQF